jgi:hypothetical protein
MRLSPGPSKKATSTSWKNGSRNGISPTHSFVWRVLDGVPDRRKCSESPGPMVSARASRI